MLFHYCVIIIEFLSFKEFKFVKNVERVGCRHEDDAPEGRMTNHYTQDNAIALIVVALTIAN